MFEYDAEITAAPTDLAVTAPAFETVMTPGEELIQVADDVRSRVLPSVKVAIAVNCSPLPRGRDCWLVFTAIETIAADETVRLAVPAIPDTEAETTEAPAALVETAPALETATTPGEELDQVAAEVRSIVLPSV